MTELANKRVVNGYPRKYVRFSIVMWFVVAQFIARYMGHDRFIG